MTGEGTPEARAFVERFAATWAAPDLGAHEALWAEDVVLVQPLMEAAVGRAACREALARLFRLVPDLRADVHRWSGSAELVFIEFTLSGTFGGRPVSWDAVDRFVLKQGLVAERVSYFDAIPLSLELASRPRGWRRLFTAGFRPRLARLG